ncbi:MAG: 2-C-methyl-D-erythritol 4-phosphate cytidylyltransferase [Atopobiaceae bacterium]|nr:2-C-methyl-D-erythritol 4-phosphate cytidylyltransferase [Atopobiaceae bacterium]
MSSLNPETSCVLSWIANDGVVPDCCAVIVAGGDGTRFGHAGGKQLVEVCGLPMVSWSVLAFEAAPSVAHIVVVCPEERLEATQRACTEAINPTTPVSFALSGERRQDSCYNGLAAVPAELPFVAIHDGARPLITCETIERVVGAVRSDMSLAGAICGQPSVDTLKLVEDQLVVATPDRSLYWCVQTPQVFRVADLSAAYERAKREGYEGTDDASLVERNGGRVLCVESPRDNLKLTVPEDLVVIEAILSARIVDAACGR